MTDYIAIMRTIFMLLFGTRSPDDQNHPPPTPAPAPIIQKEEHRIIYTGKRLEQ
jgi:hypothetical protein